MEKIYLKRTLWMSLLLGGLALGLGAQSTFASDKDTGKSKYPKRNWEKIAVPGATCGDGSQYSIFVEKRDPTKLAFDLMGGGACWGLNSCWGVTRMTWIHPIPFVLGRGGFVSTDPKESPVHDYSMVYFPYCTGDVHLGDHVAVYAKLDKKEVRVRHTGAHNLRLAISKLNELAGIEIDKAEDFVLYGFSAGALGSLAAVEIVDPLLTNATKKSVIADAPGLHFGDKVWNRFTDAQLNDFSKALEKYGTRVVRGQGSLAHVVPKICETYSDWDVAILQGSRDVVMSHIFGKIGRKAHEEKVFGKDGLYELTKNPDDRCVSWVPRTVVHTFLTNDTSAKVQSDSGVSALEFTRRIIEGTYTGENHI